jgi:hypothetical protein
MLVLLSQGDLHATITCRHVLRYIATPQTIAGITMIKVSREFVIFCATLVSGRNLYRNIPNIWVSSDYAHVLVICTLLTSPDRTMPASGIAEHQPRPPAMPNIKPHQPIICLGAFWGRLVLLDLVHLTVNMEAPARPPLTPLTANA